MTVHLEHQGCLAGHEVPGLVEDAVIGQEVFVVPGHHSAAMNECGTVHRTPTGSPDRIRIVVVIAVVEIADQAGEVCEPIVGNVASQGAHREPGCLLEGRA